MSQELHDLRASLQIILTTMLLISTLYLSKSIVIAVIISLFTNSLFSIFTHASSSSISHDSTELPNKTSTRNKLITGSIKQARKDVTNCSKKERHLFRAGKIRAIKIRRKRKTNGI